VDFICILGCLNIRRYTSPLLGRFFCFVRQVRLVVQAWVHRFWGWVVAVWLGSTVVSSSSWLRAELEKWNFVPVVPGIAINSMTHLPAHSRGRTMTPTLAQTSMHDKVKCSIYS